MYVEINSLLPVLTENFEEPAIEKAIAALEEEQRLFYSLYEEFSETPPQNLSAESAGEGHISLLLEQLLRFAEKNAVTSEKVVELLENQEETPHVTFN
jgi:hypothetical protein